MATAPLSVLDPITARYYSLARTSNEPMTEHCDELITGTAVLSLSSFYITILAYSSCWVLLDLLNDAFQLQRSDLQRMAVIIWKSKQNIGQRLSGAISSHCPGRTEETHDIFSRSRFYPRSQNMEHVNPATANVGALYPLIFVYLMTLLEQNTSREARSVHF